MPTRTAPCSAGGRWSAPLPGRLWPTREDSRAAAPPGCVELPLPPHPGSFGALRTHHTHEGVDLYVPEGTPVAAVEPGVVVAVEAFTGARAGSPWWLDTDAVLVEGDSGVVLYGEIAVEAGIAPRHGIKLGDRIGTVRRVLRHDKGRPTSMLHLELHVPGTRASVEWTVGAERPPSLRDPTERLTTSVPWDRAGTRASSGRSPGRLIGWGCCWSAMP